MRLLADMSLFVEVCNTRHFGRAAAALDMPASTLSRRIKRLEIELGLPLIHRSTRSFQLTDAGAACYARAQTLIMEANQIREDLTRGATTAVGHIRVGLPLDLAQTIFLPMFTAFVRLHPGVSIEVLNLEGHPSLVAESLDLGFMVAHQTALPDSSQWSRKIGLFARKLFASKQYLKTRPAPGEPAGLADHECILFSAESLQRRWALRRGREKASVVVKGVAAANSVGLVAQFAREHMGIALLPDFLARLPSFGGGLVRVLPEWEGEPAYILAVTPAQLLPGKTRRLVEYARSEFGTHLARAEAGNLRIGAQG